MPMKQWHEIPAVFRKNTVLSCAAAIGSLLITVTVFFAAGDRSFLYLGLMLFLLSILKTLDLVITIVTDRYERVVGICSSIDPPLFSQNAQICITLTSGITIILSVGRRHRFQRDRAYVLYFKAGTPLAEGSSLWLQRAQADALLAYEEFDLENYEE